MDRHLSLSPCTQKLLDMLDAALPCKLMLDCMHCIAACLQFFGEEGVQEVAFRFLLALSVPVIGGGSRKKKRRRGNECR